MTTLLPREASWLINSQALAASDSAAGGCDCSPDGVVQLERLQFLSLDEPMLIQMRLEQRKRDQQRDRWIGRAFGAGVALTTGVCIDGFGLPDLTGAVMGGLVGDLTVEGLHHRSDQELEQLGLKWAIAPDSLIFHQRRHGQPLHRMLLMAKSRGGRLRTTCAVRFSDGYLAFFSTEPFRCELAAFSGARKLTAKGAMPDRQVMPRTIGDLSCSDGRARPLQALMTDKGCLLAMEVPTPHHSLY